MVRTSEIQRMLNKPLRGTGRKVSTVKKYYYNGRYYRVYTDTTGAHPVQFIESKGHKIYVAKGIKL